MNEYISEDRHKYYLKAHVILVCKYRKRLLADPRMDIEAKSIIQSIADRSDFQIEVMETDADHIHMLISYPPRLSVTSIVRKIKQESTVQLWKVFAPILSKHFWKEHTFWSDGFFACSIGEANPATIRKYIENQG